MQLRATRPPGTRKPHECLRLGQLLDDELHPRLPQRLRLFIKPCFLRLG